jgi:hypothetical protein
MKRIPLRILGKKENGFDYKLLIKNILSVPVNPQVGLTVDEIRKAVRIMDLIDKSKDKLELEDADYDYLKNRIETNKFAIAHKDIIEFVDDILEAGK